jgi:starch synthase
VFKDYDPKQMLAAIQRAVALFEKKRLWQKFMKQAMTQDFSWENSARQYIDLYHKARST